MSKIGQIRALVRNGLYYLTEHALDEAVDDGLDVYDVEYCILNGKIRKTWPREGKYEVAGWHWTDARLVLFAVSLNS